MEKHEQDRREGLFDSSFDEISSNKRRQERMQTLRKDPAWRAVLRIFRRLGRDERIWMHVDLERERINFKAMLDDGTFSGGELRMIEIAAALFNQDHKVNLWTVLGRLDEDNSAAVIAAMQDFVSY